MDKTYLKTLELDKILAQAAEYATCAEARALLVDCLLYTSRCV